ncbi:MAG: nicotinate-nucleotide adenylyltransferase [Pseudomonadota bacterium]
MRIGLFGGSFNPAHGGHRHVATTALKALQLDWVWWIVARGNPLKTEHGDFQTRLRSAQAHAQHPRMIATDIEQRAGIRFTRDTLGLVLQRAPSARFVWIMGGDSLRDFHRWKDWSYIAAAVPICVVARPDEGKAKLSSPFARRFSGARVPAQAATLLPSLSPPAWTYINAPLHPASSTALRLQNG